MSQGVTKLKELLFESESRALTDLERRIETVAKLGTDQRAALSRDLERVAATEQAYRNEIRAQVDAVFSRAGTEERFKNSVAEVIDRALADAEITRHDELSKAVAPLVVRTIKREIHESQDELVEALYPITGRLVQAYVASAIRDLTERINAQVSNNATMLRINSVLTGRSVAELALAQSQDLAIDELYLIRRGSGELLARWPDAKNSLDRDQLMSGILTAINEFALEAFDDNASSLRQVDLNTSQVYLRASPRLLLAAKCSGVTNAAVERLIDEEFITALERRAPDWDEPAASPEAKAVRQQFLAETAERIDGRIEKIRSDLAGSSAAFLLFKTLGWLLALALAGWIAWAGYKYVTTESVRGRAQNVIATTESMRGYPVKLTVADYGTDVNIAGLAPSAQAKADMLSRLESELAGIPVNNQIAIVPTAPDATPQIVNLREDLAALKDRLQRESLDRSSARALRRLALLPPDLARLADNIDRPRPTAVVARATDTTNEVHDALQALREKRLAQTAPLEGAAVADELNALRRRLAASANELSSLLDKEDAGSSTQVRSADPQSDTSAPAAAAGGNVIATAEELAVETERFATLVVALAQAASVKPAPVVVSAPPPAGPTPREQLAAWMRDHAIFFSTATRYRDPELATRHLDELAKLILATDAVVRIVGFTDEQGGTQQNSPLSQERADIVRRALLSRGIPDSRMIAIGRLDAKDISAVVGEASPNRRVEFEMGFIGEPAQ